MTNDEHKNGDVAVMQSAAELGRAGYIAAFGDCFASGRVVAGRAFDADPNAKLTHAGVLRALCEQFYAATQAEKMEILKAYTPLDPGVRAARLVTEESDSDGLRAMTARQQRRLLDLLNIYSERLGFGAIFVVRNYTTAELLAALEKRAIDERDAEYLATYAELERLAEIRIGAYFSASRP